MIAKQKLDQQQIETFVPMHYEVVGLKNKTKSKELVPFIKNLIFVHATPLAIKKIKLEFPYIQYMMEIQGKKKTPIIVSENRMQQFIEIVQCLDTSTVYLKPEEICLDKGTFVLIHGGVFDGKEGIFLKVKGKRSKRVVIAIPGVIAVIIADIHPDLLEVIK